MKLKIFLTALLGIALLTFSATAQEKLKVLISVDMEGITGVLAGYPVAQRAEVVAEMDVAGWLHARQHARGVAHGRRRYPVEGGPLR